MFPPIWVVYQKAIRFDTRRCKEIRPLVNEILRRNSNVFHLRTMDFQLEFL